MVRVNQPLIIRPVDSPRTSPEYPIRDLLENGLLHFINEKVLWPYGLALSIDVPHTPTGEDWDKAVLWVADDGPPGLVITGLGVDEHKARHRAARRLMRERRASRTLA